MRLTVLLLGALVALMLYVLAISAWMHRNIRPPVLPFVEQSTPSPRTEVAQHTVSAHDAAVFTTSAAPPRLPALTTTAPRKAKVHWRRAAADYGSGYTVADSDHRAHAHPGGTEAEADEDRRRIEGRNRDAIASDEFWRITQWRVAERPQAVPASLLATQVHLDDAEGSFGDLPLLARAVSEDCGGDVELRDFACLIASYENQLSASRQQDSCRRIYGFGLIERLRRHAYDMCGGGGKKSASRLVCHSDRIAPDHTVHTAVCGGADFLVDYSKMLDGDFPWLSFQPGALQVHGCPGVRDAAQRPESAQPPQWQFIHCLRDWMTLGLRDEASESSDADDVGDEATTTFFVTRSGDYSPFALAHDWVNTVIAYAVANISRTDVQIRIMERMTVGFFSPMWSLAFSPRRPLLWFPDFRRREKRRRFRRAFFNIPARLSPLYNSDACGVSPVLRFTSDLIVSRVGAHAVRSPDDCFVIVLIVRRNYATGHSIERRIPNWRQLADALRRGIDVSLSSSSPSSAAVVVHALDYADFDFDQQLNVSRSADLIVGMHGAGLIQAMFLPLHGGVFEIFCPDRPPSNTRYENLARRLGIEYGSFYTEDASNAVPVDLVVSSVSTLARRVMRRKLKARRG